MTNKMPLVISKIGKKCYQVDTAEEPKPNKPKGIPAKPNLPNTHEK